MRGKFRLWYGWYSDGRGNITKNLGDFHLCSEECLKKMIDDLESKGIIGGNHRVDRAEDHDATVDPTACDECKGKCQA